MRALHHALMGIALIAALVISVGVTQPWIPAAVAQHSQESTAQHGHSPGVQHSHAAETQHSHASDAQDHFHQMVGELDLTAEQQDTLAEPFQEAFAAMQKLHQLHDVIAAELTDEQKGKLAQMIHEMLGASFAEQLHGHGDPHEAHH